MVRFSFLLPNFVDVISGVTPILVFCNGQRFFRFYFGYDWSVFLGEAWVVEDSLRMCVLFVRVEVDSLGEPLETNEAEVGLLPAVDQLVSL